MQLLRPFLLILNCYLSITLNGQNFKEGKDYALFFAVSDYAEWPVLNNPISDAEKIANDLREYYDFETEVVRNPTKEEILVKLAEYYDKQFLDESQLFLFFTGHGTFVDRTKEGFFIPQNGKLNDFIQDSYVPHSRLEKIVNQIPCKHILLAIDACFSGTFDKRIATDKGRDFERPGSNPVRDFISRRLKYKSRLYLTSGGKERTTDGVEHSPFTGEFLEALRSFGGSDGILTFSELLGFMEKASPLPRSGQFGNNEPGASFLFIAKDQVSKYRAMESVLVGDTLIDLRDNKKYPTAILKDGNRWMMSNMDYQVDGSYCCGSPNKKVESCYIRHYSWEIAPVICPKGWHLPTHAEWEYLVKQYGGITKPENGEARLDIIQEGRGGSLFINGQESTTGVTLRSTDFYEYFLRNRTACTGKPDDRMGTYWANPIEKYPGKWVFSFFNEPYMDAPVMIQLALRAPTEFEEYNRYQSICIRCIQD